MSSRAIVIIANWNGKRFLERCLRSLVAQSFQDFEVVLVDNGSTDGSVSFVRERFPQVHLIENRENRGFAAANNQAIRATHSEFVVTLNNDTEVAREWLGELVAAAETDRKVGACASWMLFARRPEMINSAGIALDRAGIAWDWRGGELDNPEEREAEEVFGACAGAALYRRRMLDEIGLFDEDFFAYLEDVDLAWRAQWAGWHTLSVPTARVLHYHSATGGEGSPFKNRLLGRNRVWLVAKNYPWPHLLWYLPLILLYDVSSLTYALVSRGNWPSLYGRIEGVVALPGVLRKRWRIAHVRRVPERRMLSCMAPLPSPWVLWRRYAHLRGNGSS